MQALIIVYTPDDILHSIVLQYEADPQHHLHFWRHIGVCFIASGHMYTVQDYLDMQPFT